MDLPQENRRFQIQRMWDIHHHICRLALIGVKHKRIAEIVGCSESTVYNTLNSEVVRRHMSMMRAAADVQAVDVAAEIQKNAPAAVGVLADTLADDNVDRKLRVHVAKDILDRAGHSAIKRTQTEAIHAHLTKEDIAEIKKRARLMSTKGDEPIDVGGNGNGNGGGTT